MKYTLGLEVGTLSISSDAGQTGDESEGAAQPTLVKVCGRRPQPGWETQLPGNPAASLAQQTCVDAVGQVSGREQYGTHPRISIHLTLHLPRDR